MSSSGMEIYSEAQSLETMDTVPPLLSMVRRAPSGQTDMD